jgi:diacylglycerol kinase (ATP)
MRSYSSENQLQKSQASSLNNNGKLSVVVESKISEDSIILEDDEEGEEDLRPKSDHDRFKEAWASHIQFADYRRLVLPPECKLVELTSQWREIEQTLLDRQFYKCLFVSRMRAVLMVLNRLFHYLNSLLSGETVHKFSCWVVGLYRYRILKQRGMSVDDDDASEDEDDTSVATMPSGGVTTILPSDVGSVVAMSPGVPNHQSTIVKSPEATPVVRNRVFFNESATNFPLQQLSLSEHATINKYQESENDSSLMNIPQSTNVRPRLNTSESNDDSAFASLYEDLGEKPTLSASEVPTFVEKSKKTMNVSPLLLERNRNIPKKERRDVSPIKLGGVPTSQTTMPLEPSQSADSTLNFFDTANSDRQLRDMSRAVPIPDARGYILGDEFIGASSTPLLVFVNSRSGSRNGNLLITQFRRLLNPIQVWDLAHGGPEKVLKSFSVLSRFQLLVCGGDGTVSWIISALEKLKLERWPPIGILPLGTGNDLSRIHGWGGGYNNESLLLILSQISESYISMLDLWELDITKTTKKGKRKEEKEVKSFMNYLGVGVDAQATLQVHNLRERKGWLFFSRFFNKAWYFFAGGEEAIKSSCANLAQQISVVADGTEIQLPPDSQGIIFLNIDSYAGGIPMWSNGLKPQKRIKRSFSEGDSVHGSGNDRSFSDSFEDCCSPKSFEDFAEVGSSSKALTNCDSPSSCQDGLLDVVSVRGTFHLGQIRVGLSNAQLLCQCREATVTLKKRVAVQIDGEPWRQSPSTLKIVRKPERATMLNKSTKDSGGGENEITKLLNWANGKEIIDRQQYAM